MGTQVPHPVPEPPWMALPFHCPLGTEASEITHSGAGVVLLFAVSASPAEL